jgi:hypothetical protein
MRSNLAWNGTTQEWQMHVVGVPGAVATSSATLATLALGTHRWLVAGDTQCSPQPRHLLLTLSTCQADQFTCGDGHCVSLEQRCDSRADCGDKSDEVGGFALLSIDQNNIY